MTYNSSLPPIVVFDLDGTLLDTAKDLHKALNETLNYARQEPTDFSRLRDYVGQGGAAMLKRVYDERGIPLSETDRSKLVEVFIDTYEADIPGYAKPYEGAIELVETLRQNGFKTAICTNKFQRLTDKVMAGLKLTDYFDAICGSDAFPVRKPDPQHLTGTIERAGGNPQRAVMIGDSITDIATAKNADIPVVGVTFGYTDTPIAELNPTKVIDHYDELKDLNWIKMVTHSQ